MRRAVGLATGLVACALLTLRAQAPSSAQQPPPTFRAGIDIVQLDVSVLDRDRQPVKGLTAADFTVLENGVPQPIVAFDPVDIPAAVEPTAPWMRDASPDLVTNEKAARRVVVIVFDDAFIPPAAGPMAKRIARDAVSSMGPADLGAVTFTDSGRRQDVTTDRQRLLKSIDSFVGHQGIRGGSLSCRYRGRRYRSVAACVLDTLVTAAEALRSAPQGRKTLVYISGGVPFDFSMSDMRGPDNAAEEVIAIQAMLRSLQEGNVNVYAIDPSGLTPAGIMSPALDSLRMFSEQTGGRATVATNTPWEAVPQIFRENSSYYMLGIRSAVEPGDKRFHRIQVKVNRPGLEARVRSGYYGRRPDDANTPAASPVDTALGLPVPGGELPLGVTVAPLAIPGEKSAALAVAIALREPPEPSNQPRVLEVGTMALDADCGDCKQLPSTRQTVHMTGAAQQVEFLSRLALAPGSYEIRVGAALDGRAGGVFTHVDIPDFRKARLSASGLVLSAPSAVETANADVFSDLLPVVPVALREFRANVPVTAWVRLYQGGSKAPGAVRVTATILDAAGQPNLDQTLFLDSAQFSRDRSVEYQLELPISTLEAGLHLLTVEAHLGDSVVRRQATFTVR